MRANVAFWIGGLLICGLLSAAVVVHLTVRAYYPSTYIAMSLLSVDVLRVAVERAGGRVYQLRDVGYDEAAAVIDAFELRLSENRPSDRAAFERIVQDGRPAELVQGAKDALELMYAKDSRTGAGTE